MSVLITVTNRKLHTGFRLLPTSGTLKGVIALILHHFIEFDSFGMEADYVTVVEDRPIMSAKYRLPVIFGKTCPTQQSHGLFATAKLLDNNLRVFVCLISEPRL